jgi:hypothetical protein
MSANLEKGSHATNVVSRATKQINAATTRIGIMVPIVERKQCPKVH